MTNLRGKAVSLDDLLGYSKLQDLLRLIISHLNEQETALQAVQEQNVDLNVELQSFLDGSNLKFQSVLSQALDARLVDSETRLAAAEADRDDFKGRLSALESQAQNSDLQARLEALGNKVACLPQRFSETAEAIVLTTAEQLQASCANLDERLSALEACSSKASDALSAELEERVAALEASREAAVSSVVQHGLPAGMQGSAGDPEVAGGSEMQQGAGVGQQGLGNLEAGGLESRPGSRASQRTGSTEATLGSEAWQAACRRLQERVGSVEDECMSMEERLHALEVERAIGNDVFGGGSPTGFVETLRSGEGEGPAGDGHRGSRHSERRSDSPRRASGSGSTEAYGDTGSTFPGPGVAPGPAPETGTRMGSASGTVGAGAVDTGLGARHSRTSSPAGSTASSTRRRGSNRSTAGGEMTPGGVGPDRPGTAAGSDRPGTAATSDRPGTAGCSERPGTAAGSTTASETARSSVRSLARTGTPSGLPRPSTQWGPSRTISSKMGLDRRPEEVQSGGADPRFSEISDALHPLQRDVALAIEEATASSAACARLEQMGETSAMNVEDLRSSLQDLSSQIRAEMTNAIEALEQKLRSQEKTTRTEAKAEIKQASEKGLAETRRCSMEIKVMQEQLTAFINQSSSATAKCLSCFDKRLQRENKAVLGSDGKVYRRRPSTPGPDAAIDAWLTESQFGTGRNSRAGGAGAAMRRYRDAFAVATSSAPTLTRRPTDPSISSIQISCGAAHCETAPTQDTE
mmetsp:Transcript_52841/g.114219  ORF Transcript_52841/g.114219 Transcript_52841/m.114219 type:complete len:750 (+) Transcript_52841:104-2353(+)